MSPSDLLQEIGQKEADKNEIIDRVIEDPELIHEIIDGLSTNKARIKYGCARILRLLSEKKPEILYPWFNFFVDLLESDNSFLKWDAIHVLGNLAAVDSDNRFEKVYDRYFAPITGPVLITAANVIGGAARIALAKPALTERVTKEILKVEKARYQTAECRNVVLGQAIDSFDRFFNQVEDKEPVIALVQRQLKNTRNSTRKKAEKFIKKHRIEVEDMSSDAEMQNTAGKALEDEKVLSELLEGVLSKDETIRFGSFNALLLISEEHPEVLYPQWDFFSGLLSSKNTYHKYIAIYIIANLTRIDTEGRFEMIFDDYFGLLNDRSVIPATHVASNAGKIVVAKPGLRGGITDELLNIKKGPDTTSRNRNIDLVIAGAIEALDTCFEEADDRARIIEFVTRQLDSRSLKTREKARDFLKKWG